MLKTKKKDRNKILVILLLFIILGGLLFYFNSNYQFQGANISHQVKTFNSSNLLKFSIDLPVDYEVAERFGSVSVNSSRGTISIDRNGTNFTNLKDYVENSRNNLKETVQKKEFIKINGLESMVGVSGNQRIYFIYFNYSVYILSTSSDALYDDLDQIARSFRYTGKN